MNWSWRGIVGPVWDAHLARVRFAHSTPNFQNQRSVTMSTVQKSIDVNVPVSTAYNQWTQFEEFPRFMEGVKSVRQLDDKRMHWKTEIGGKEQDFAAIIDQQGRDQRMP